MDLRTKARIAAQQMSAERAKADVGFGNWFGASKWLGSPDTIPSVDGEGGLQYPSCPWYYEALQLTKDQLKTDSPYNTYLYKGLPPGPIANPSLDSIMAAITPTKNNSLYYLSDRQGTMHFCVTYSCQLANARKYLGN